MRKLEQRVKKNMKSLDSIIDNVCNKYILTTTHHPQKKTYQQTWGCSEFHICKQQPASTSTPGDCMPLAMRKCSQSLVDSRCSRFYPGFPEIDHVHDTQKAPKKHKQKTSRKKKHVILSLSHVTMSRVELTSTCCPPS